MFDINLYPLYIKNSNEQAYLPGLRFQAAPKNASRVRNGDLLMLLASPSSQNELPEDRLQLILEATLREYFQSTGTVTSGMKRIAENINEAVLEYNLKESQGGKQISLVLNCAVIHGERVYIGHAGFTHSFVLNKDETQHHFDPEGSGRGLGLSRSTTLRFFLGDIRQDEFIIFSPEPLSTWTPANLGDSHSFALDFIKRRLLNQVSPNVRALLVQLRQGSGRMILQPPLSSTGNPPVQSQSEHGAPRQSSSTGRSIPMMAIPLKEKATAPAGDTTTESRRASQLPLPTIPVQQLSSATAKHPAKPIPSHRPDIQVEESELSYKEAFLELVSDIRKLFSRTKDGTGKVFSSVKKENPPRHPDAEIRFRRPNTEKLDKFVASTGKAATSSAGLIERIVKKIGGWITAAFKKLVNYMAPGGGFKLPSLPNSAMILISIAIPLIVVVTAASMYLNRGQTSQFDYYLVQAQTAAAQTANIQDPAAQRSAWENVIVLLDKAGKFGDSKDADKLRTQARDVLDDLAGIARLEFTPAIVDGLPGSVNVVQMLSTNTELYLLDASSGQVLRAVLTGKGYELDPTFNCAPGPFGSYMVDPFVDITLLPKGNTLNASLAAMDARGNLVYCSPGGMATSMTLMAPDSGWGSIKAMTVDSYRLYVLDVTNNAIWMYLGGIGAYINKPESYFDKNSPAMQDVQDFAINGNDLYLLHTDGHLTTCTYSEVYGADTKCKDPVPYVVLINGGEKKPVIVPNTTFTQLQYSQPPDPSIYILDSSGPSLYHFSLRMTLQKQLAMQSGDPYRLEGKAATAFTVNTGKVLFIAFGNRLYSAIEP
ncbi:MAG: hypothetical protein C0391_05075 [Anaerolinea sp.]|nr:hypothetical protein [Anaerolinea sp.]